MSPPSVRLHRGQDGSPLERLRERHGGSGPISIQASLPQSSDHSGEPAGVVGRFEPRRVCFWLQLVQPLYEALQCDRCHRPPFSPGHGRDRGADSAAPPPPRTKTAPPPPSPP